jgi:hypothetical protein
MESLLAEVIDIRNSSYGWLAFESATGGPVTHGSPRGFYTSDIRLATAVRRSFAAPIVGEVSLATELEGQLDKPE